jgi:hypothetical protein
LLAKNPVTLMQVYLVFASSFFSSAGFSGIGAASLAGSLGVAAAGGAGSAGAAGGGGGGAGSSFLPHPTNVTVKAKSVTADNKTNFFPILDSPPFPSHILKNLCLLRIWYRICWLVIQAAGVSNRAPITFVPRRIFLLLSVRLICERSEAIPENRLCHRVRKKALLSITFKREHR